MKHPPLPWQDVPKPTLSPRLRALVEALAADVGSVTRSITEAVYEIADYRHAADAMLASEVERMVGINTDMWYQALLQGQSPSEAQLELISVLAGRRVHQGVSLPGLLRAYRMAQRGYWTTMLASAGQDLELHSELLFQVSPYLIHHFDMLSQVMAWAWNAEQSQHERWRDRLRSELWTVISVRPDDVEAFRNHTEALGIDPTASACAMALCVRSPAPQATRIDNAMHRMMVEVGRITGQDGETIMRALHRGNLLVWLSAAHGETLLEHVRRINSHAAEIARRLTQVVAVGVGLPGSGPRGWRMSAEQAGKSADGREPADREATLVCYSDVALYDIVTTSDNVKRYFDALIERLAIEPQLLETLTTFFELKQHRKAVSAALNVHPNTLSYRLERIEQILSADLSDMSWLTKLHTALGIRRRD